jgi:anti-sigma28 factor (negative regulator of flagellin synthesis)
MDFSERLKHQANRLENIMSAIENGSLKVSDIDEKIVDNLEAKFTEYEEILNKSNE